MNQNATEIWLLYEIFRDTKSFAFPCEIIFL